MSQLNGRTESKRGAATYRVPAKTVVMATAGNFVEYFDWGIYSVFSVYFSKQIFPSADPLASALSTFAVFAVGFLMRPIGGWLLGMYSDRAGKRRGLTLTVSMMACGSITVAITPTHAVVGAWAAVILLIARLVQGLAIGGEFGSAVTYLSEIAPNNRRGFYGGFQYMTIAAGTLAGSMLGFVMSHTLSTAQLESWGWRLAFLIGAAFGLVVFFMRRGSITESAGDAGAQSHTKSTLGYLLRHNLKGAVQIFAMTMSTALIYYIWGTFLQVHAVNTYGMDPGKSFMVASLALVVFVVVQPVFGRLSDTFGRKPFLLIYAVGFAVLVFPLTKLLTFGPLGLFGAMVIGYLIFGFFSGSSAAVKSEQFPNHIRALGVSFPYATASAIFGGTAPYLLTLFTKIGHPWIFWVYTIVLLLISAVSFLFLKESKGVSLDEIEDHR